MIITDLFESHQLCPECGGPAFSDLILAEKKDACYSKVRSRYKVWPSAYASGALVQCRKKGAANWGNKSKNEGVAESDTGDTPIDSMTAQELADYLNMPVDRVTKDIAGAREMAQDKARDTVGESMADDLLKIAQKISPGARLRGTPDQEREREQQIRAQRAQERQAIQQSMIQADIDKLPELEAQYQEMKQLYDSLGGSNWQYADREQNLSSSERRARDMEPQMQQLLRRIQMAKQAQNIAEGNLEATSADPVVIILDPAGKYLDKMALSAAAQKYPLGTPDAIKKQLAHQNYTKIGQYTIQAPMTGQPAEPAMAESLDRILKLSGLRP